MANVVSINKARRARAGGDSVRDDPAGFVPCSQDMTICGDCEGNRARKKCPRLREWLEKNTVNR